jgi:hypothetical protein
MKNKRGDGCAGENDKHKKQKAHTTGITIESFP